MAESDDPGEYDLQFIVELLNKLTAELNLADHKHTLKVGFPVIRFQDRDPIGDHVKGVRYTLTAVSSILLIPESFTGDNGNSILALPETPCNPSDSNYCI